MQTIADISNPAKSSKLKYNNHKTAPNTYWKILETFVNGTNIPLIPLLLVGNQLVTDFLVKWNLYNGLWIDGHSYIPANIDFETEGKDFLFLRFI